MVFSGPPIGRLPKSCVLPYGILDTVVLNPQHFSLRGAHWQRMKDRAERTRNEPSTTNATTKTINGVPRTAGRL
jgi:hypothetical protein